MSHITHMNESCHTGSSVGNIGGQLQSMNPLAASHGPDAGAGAGGEGGFGGFGASFSHSGLISSSKNLLPSFP